MQSSEGTEEGRRAALPPPPSSAPLTAPPPPLSLSSLFWTVQWSFPVTAVLLSRGGGSSTGREAAWDRWTCLAPPPTTASLIKNRSAATIDVLSRVGANESVGLGWGGGGVGCRGQDRGTEFVFFLFCFLTHILPIMVELPCLALS